MKKNYYCYRATVVFSGAVGAVSEEEAIDKVVKDSKRLPETVSFTRKEVKVRKLQKKPEKGLYHDPKYEL
tara:strand:+ start:4582 stop:4791 length:210 start_codon:yes stop_codon:yes gene_type:complete